MILSLIMIGGQSSDGGGPTKAEQQEMDRRDAEKARETQARLAPFLNQEKMDGFSDRITALDIPLLQKLKDRLGGQSFLSSNGGDVNSSALVKKRQINNQKIAAVENEISRRKGKS